MSNPVQINAGRASVVTRVKGDASPIGNRVIVRDMHFGDTTTNGGIIVLNDDGKDRGIKARWGRVYAKGPQNNDPYDIGDWILVDHGRWTRSYEIEKEDGEVVTMRTVEAESVLGWQTEQPEDIIFGSKEGTGPSESIKPENFVRA